MPELPSRGRLQESLRPPAQSESAEPATGIFAEAPGELYVDALLATEGGAAAETETAPEERARKKLGPVFWISVGWITLVILAAIFARFLPIKSYTETGVGPPRTHPNSQFWFGTDELGRDMLARVIYGARVSMVVGFASILAAFIIGGGIGVIAGYYGGKLGRLLMGCMDVFLAFPALVAALALVTFLGQSLRNVTIAIALVSIAPVARIIRASTLTFAEREFVTAARTLGAKNRRIIVREILPNVLPPAASYALIGVAIAIVAEGALAFLGLSVRAPTPSWGSMINEGRSFLEHDAYISLIPAAIMFLTVLSFNFAGDSLRAFFDVKESAL